MKKAILVSVLVILSMLPISPSEAIERGSKCKIFGAFNSNFICLKSGKSLIWQKFQTVLGVQAAISLSLKSSNLPKDLRPELSKVRSDKSLWLDQECSVDFSDVTVPNCLAGDPNGKKTMVVYGDSHASMWMTALDSIAQKSGYRIYLFAKLACPLVEVPIWSYQLNRTFDECLEWQKLVLPRIESLKPDVLIVTDQWKPVVIEGKKSDAETPSVWSREFPRALQKLNSYTKKLIVLSNNPSMQQDSVSCASKPRAIISQCVSSRNQAGNLQINRIEQEAAKNLSATFINTVDFACNDYLCPIVIAKQFVYFDQWHFTATYVNWLRPVLEKSMNL